VRQYTEVQGTLSPLHPSITVQVPVNVTTSSFGLSVRSTTVSNLGQVPVVQRLLLVDGQGDTVDQYEPDSAQGQPAPQSVDVLLRGAPEGGRLLVQIATADGAQAVQTGTVPPSSPDRSATVSFVLGVQRQDQSLTPQGVTSVLGQAVVGTLLFISSMQSGRPSGPD
jgi:hypothetical protein